MSWLPYVYQYSVMGVIFIASLILCWRQGYVGLKKGKPRRNLGLLVGGFLFFMALHGYFQFLTPPVPADAHGTKLDRFFIRTFTPLGAPYESSKGWVQKMKITGEWVYCPSGKQEKAYSIVQEVDAGYPSARYDKVCPIFNKTLTDWHPEVLEHFTHYGFRFKKVDEQDCQNACAELKTVGFLPKEETLADCTKRCLKTCSAQYMKIYLGKEEK